MAVTSQIIVGGTDCRVLTGFFWGGGGRLNTLFDSSEFRLSVVREKVLGIVWGTYVGSPRSVKSRKCPWFFKGVVSVPWRSCARKRAYTVFWNVPAFPGEGSFGIFSTSIAVLIVADPSSDILCIA